MDLNETATKGDEALTTKTGQENDTAGKIMKALKEVKDKLKGDKDYDDYGSDSDESKQKGDKKKKKKAKAKVKDKVIADSEEKGKKKGKKKDQSKESKECSTMKVTSDKEDKDETTKVLYKQL